MKTVRLTKIFALLALLQAHSIAVQSKAASTLPISISPSAKQIHFTNHLGKLSKKLTVSLIDDQENSILKSEHEDSPDKANILHANLPDSTIQISRSRPREGEHHLQEFTFVWSPVLDKTSLKSPNSDSSANKKKVCLDYSPEGANAYVYPTVFSSDLSEQVFAYPMRNVTHSFKGPFVSGISPVGSILDRLFFLSTGFALLLDDPHPWAVSVHSALSKLCFYLDYGQQPFNSQKVTHPRAYFSIKFRLLLGSSLKAVWRAAVGHLGYIRRPRQAPSLDLFHTPIYPVFPFVSSGLPNYHALGKLFQCLEEWFSPNQTAVLFVDDSVSWQEEADQFAITNGIDELKSLAVKLNQTQQGGKYQLAIWISSLIWGPAASDESWLMYPDRRGIKYALDFTALKAQRFFLSHLAAFSRESPFTRFFFSDGHLAAFIGKSKSRGYVLKTPTDPVVGKYPSFLTSLYGQTIGHFQPASGAIDAAYKMQPLPLFIRLKIGYVTYGRVNCLKQLLSQALILATAGYQFIQPELSELGATPDDGVLFLKRWNQAVTFFPVMTITELGSKEASSEKEWSNFMNSTAELLALREKMVSPLLGDLLSNWTEKGEPLFRPMWYAAADDDVEEVRTALYQIDDQFMLGENLVVAPVVELGETQRDVYLPGGTWVSGLTGRSHVGPCLIKKAFVSTEQLLYFTRQL